MIGYSVWKSILTVSGIPPESIALEIPMSKSELIAATLETIRQNDLHDGYIRLIVTRGVGSLGLSPESCRRPSVIIIAATIALYPEDLYHKGLTMVTCSTRRTSAGRVESAGQIAELPEQHSGKA